MKRKLVLATILIVTLSMLSLSFNVQRAEATGTIYIRADGSIDPPTAPITNVGNSNYTFYGDISDPLVVERDNIVIDGAHFTIQVAFYQIGINISYRSNVTVKNTIIKSAFSGLHLNHTTAAVLIDNNLVNNGFGIVLHNSSNCEISGNTVASNQYDGIQLYYSSNSNSISGNDIIANYNDGIAVSESSTNNTISSNNVTNCGVGISVSDMEEIDSSVSNTISENNVTNNGYMGINLESSNNTVYDNNISANNGTGIYVVLYSSNRVFQNNITGNGGNGIYLYGSFNMISRNIVSRNNGSGIYVTESSNNTISDNNITDNVNGISLTYLSDNNTLSGNSLELNDCGIYFYSANNNSIFHNNFIGNAHQIQGEYFRNNSWDDGYPSGGNYWSNYTGIDLCSGPNQNVTGSDGIGDTSYVIDANNVDHYPLVNQYVVPEFPSFLILLPFMSLAVFATCVKRIVTRRRSG